MTKKYSIDQSSPRYDSINHVILDYPDAQKIYSWTSSQVRPFIDVNDLIEQLDCDITSEMMADSDANWSDHIDSDDRQFLQEILVLWCNQFSQTVYKRDDGCMELNAEIRTWIASCADPNDPEFPIKSNDDTSENIRGNVAVGAKLIDSPLTPEVFPVQYGQCDKNAPVGYKPCTRAIGHYGPCSHKPIDYLALLTEREERFGEFVEIETTVTDEGKS